MLEPATARLILDLVGLPTLAVEQPVTARAVAAIPAELADFRLGTSGRTMGELARHIVTTELRFLATVADPARGFEPLPFPTNASPAELAAHYRSSVAAVRSALEKVSGEILVQPLDYQGVLRMPGLGFVQFALNHSIHHRGQLTACFRAQDLTPPAVYG